MDPKILPCTPDSCDPPMLQVQWGAAPRASPRWRGRAHSEKSNCRQKRSGSVSTLHWLRAEGEGEGRGERAGKGESEGRRERERGEVRGVREGRSYPRHGSLPHAFRSQGIRGPLGEGVLGR